MGTRTKSILIYVGGIVTGIILTFAFLFLIAVGKGTFDNNVVLFEKPQQEIKATSFEVIQVLSNGNALARVEDMSNFGMIVLFLADEGIAYYDDQKIAVPSGKRVMQIGTYKYTTRQNIEKTVPIIEFINK